MAAINVFSSRGALPLSPPPLSNLTLYPTLTHGSGRGRAVPALGLALGDLEGSAFSPGRSEAVTTGKPQPPWPTGMLRCLSQPCREATRGEHSPRAAGGGFGTGSHAQPSLDSHVRGHATSANAVTLQGREASPPMGLGAAESLGQTGPRGQVAQAHASLCMCL